jgi:hypothetical protein
MDAASRLPVPAPATIRKFRERYSALARDSAVINNLIRDENWLRHRPHRLTVGTQHIVMAGLLVQLALVGVAGLILWLG